MIYTDVIGPNGQTAVLVRLTGLDPGITVDAAEPLHVTVTSRRTGTSCVLPVSSYFALAASVEQLLSTAHSRPGQNVFCDNETYIRHEPGSFVELKTRSTKRGGVQLLDSEVMSIGDNPHYVITAVQQATGVLLIMCR